MKIPSTEVREEWRRLAANTDMVSAVGEYTPEEFTVLLNAVDYLESVNATLLAACKMLAAAVQQDIAIFLGQPHKESALGVALAAIQEAESS